jgi:nicotinate (nicotinamide) nucleotide adenylyltransferase
MMRPIDPAVGEGRVIETGSLERIALEQELVLGPFDETLPIAKGYPERFPTPYSLKKWQHPYPGYNPPEYESPSLAQRDRTKVPGGTADPGDVSRDEFLLWSKSGYMHSFEGAIKHDPVSGRPLSPAGRTGVSGRGALYKWGPNHAADALLTRVSGATGLLEVLLIERPCGAWAMPGGFLNTGENPRDAARRELEEETKVALDQTRGRLVYQGLGDGPRLTDNAWVETSVYHFHLDSTSRVAEQTAEANDDAKAVGWFTVTPELIRELYANHGELVASALSQFLEFNSEVTGPVREQLEVITHRPLLTSFSELRGRIGIFGGSFDPLHSGHLEVARRLKTEHALDAVVFVPAGQNPLKLRETVASPHDRVMMVERALRGERGMFVCPIQARCQGPSYTIDLVDSIRAELPREQASLFLMMGADCLPQLPLWKESARLLDEVELLPCSRKGVSLDMEELRQTLLESLGEERATKALENFTKIDSQALSSTEIREALSAGESPAAVPASIAHMIEKYGWYKKERVM